MQALVRNNIPYVLAGSIRDDGPLPDVIPNVYDAQDAMRKHTSEATTVIALATQLHTIATGNMTPSYQVVDGVVSQQAQGQRKSEHHGRCDEHPGLHRQRRAQSYRQGWEIK